MLTSFTKMFNFFIKIIDFLINKIFKIDFYGFLKDKIVQRYDLIFIKNKKIKFFIPNHTSKCRVETFFNKEPETTALSISGSLELLTNPLIERS